MAVLGNLNPNLSLQQVLGKPGGAPPINPNLPGPQPPLPPGPPPAEPPPTIPGPGEWVDAGYGMGELNNDPNSPYYGMQWRPGGDMAPPPPVPQPPVSQPPTPAPAPKPSGAPPINPGPIGGVPKTMNPPVPGQSPILGGPISNQRMSSVIQPKAMPPVSSGGGFGGLGQLGPTPPVKQQPTQYGKKRPGNY